MHKNVRHIFIIQPAFLSHMGTNLVEFKYVTRSITTKSKLKLNIILKNTPTNQNLVPVKQLILFLWPYVSFCNCMMCVRYRDIKFQ